MKRYLCQALLFSAYVFLPSGVSAQEAKPMASDAGPRVPVGPQSSITCPAGSTVFSPGNALQTIINGKPAGTSYCFNAGTYLRQSIVPKTGDTYTGKVGAVMDGQGATDHAFYGGTSGTGPSNVTVQNLVIQNYRTGGACTNADHSGCQRGAIDNRGGTGSTRPAPNWTIKNNEVRNANGVGISAQNGTKVIANYMHDNGQDGYACGNNGNQPGATGIEFSDNVIANNNSKNLIDWGWEAGGGKCWSTVGLKMIHNESYGNYGPGLWTDNDNEGTIYDGNYVHDNIGPGIFHEISWDASIINNRLWNNGSTQQFCGWLGCPQVRIAASGGVNGKSIEISGNDIKVTTGGDGVGLSQQSRGSGKYGAWLTQNVHVHHNTIDYSNWKAGSTGAVQDVNDQAIFTSRGNTFDYDTFIGLDATSGPFTWNNKGMSLAQFQAAGQETHSGLAPPQPEPPSGPPTGALIIVAPPCPQGFDPMGVVCVMVQP